MFRLNYYLVAHIFIVDGTARIYISWGMLAFIVQGRQAPLN